MKLLLIPLLVLTVSCQTVPSQQSELVVFGAAMVAEKAVQLRCPRNATELNILFSARLAFDIANVLSISNRLILDAMRAQTNESCNIITASGSIE